MEYADHPGHTLNDSGNGDNHGGADSSIIYYRLCKEMVERGITRAQGAGLSSGQIFCISR